MLIKTINPVYTSSKGGIRRPVNNVDRYWNAEGSSSSQVLAFQKWANAHGYSPRLTEDGISGPKTKAAFAKMGGAFAKDTSEKSTISMTAGDIFTKMNNALVGALGGNGGSETPQGSSQTASSRSAGSSSSAPSSGGTGSSILPDAKAEAKKVAEASVSSGGAPDSKGGMFATMDKTTKIIVIAGVSLLVVGVIIAVAKHHKTVVIKK